MFAYSRAAIDFWPGWMTEKQFEEQVTSEAAELEPGYYECRMREYRSFRDTAFALAKKVGWEGDVRPGEGGPYIAGLPTHDTGRDGHFMIAWKQDNNGDTFVVSPYRLPWLEKGDYGIWIEE
jgi:hypothetical protein